MIALVAGIIRMALVFIYHDSGDCTGDPRPDILKNFHYMYFSLFITLMTAFFAIVISLFTEKPTDKQVWFLTKIYFLSENKLQNQAYNTTSILN